MSGCREILKDNDTQKMASKADLDKYNNHFLSEGHGEGVKHWLSKMRSLVAPVAAGVTQSRNRSELVKCALSVHASSQRPHTSRSAQTSRLLQQRFLRQRLRP